MSSAVGLGRGLGARLRKATQDLHRQVEGAGIMPALLRGQLDLPTYCALLRNLHAIYAALEAALIRHAGHPDVAPVFFPALFRLAALADDLSVLHGKPWAQDLALQTATLRYVARLQALEASHPEWLAAHAYVRYLGDLSGGQMLGQIVSELFQLDADVGTHFYDFGGPESVASHQSVFRAGLSAIAADEARIGELVAEASMAFELHRELFVELAAPASAAIATAGLGL